MQARLRQFVLLLLTSTLSACAQAELAKLSTTELEARIEAIDSELETLAHKSLRSGFGSIGWRSAGHPDPRHTEWLQVDLEAASQVDQIVLVPSIKRDNEGGFNADGFPLQFKVLAGRQGDPAGQVLASFSAADELLPRIAPVMIPCKLEADWVRVVATELGTRQFDGAYNLELAEIIIFNGEENIALNRPVTVSSGEPEHVDARASVFLVDGTLPYLMNSGRGEASIAFLSWSEIGTQPSITIDLETVQPIHRIHLHSVDLSDTVPQSIPSGFATPEHIRIEGANQADFSDALHLVDYTKATIYDLGPILMRDFPETSCRYVRITALKPYILEKDYTPRSRMGFAEIELFANGHNVAINKPASGNLLNTERSLTTLTDGRNQYSSILPVRQWVEELARRHDLERERPLIAEALDVRYAQQKVNVRRLTWLAAVLLGGIAFTLLIDRMIRMRDLAKQRERFAADLHDELGANLHTIGLLSDLAEEEEHASEELTVIHQRIRNITEQTSTAMRHMTNLVDAEGLYTGLLDNMQRAGRRIMAKLEHDISVDGEDILAKLSPHTRTDLFLFYKECLVNISRHSEATKYRTHLFATNKQIDLRVHDNGRGISSGIPKSLKRRAKLLGAKIQIDSPTEGGTTIHLTLRLSRKHITRT